MLNQSHATAAFKRTKKSASCEPDRDSFMRLTLTERRRVLREQARKLLDCYSGNSEITGIGGGDFIGC